MTDANLLEPIDAAGGTEPATASIGAKSVQAGQPPAPLAITELLVEEISIDGMCGVY